MKICGSSDAKWCPTLATPWTITFQAPWSMGFSRQEYWNGLPFPSQGDLPNPGVEPRSPALQADSLPTELRGKPLDENLNPHKKLRIRDIYVCMLSHVRLFAIPWTIQPAKLLCPWNLSWQGYWSVLPFPPPGDNADPGIKLASPVSLALQADSLLLSHQGSPL